MSRSELFVVEFRFSGNDTWKRHKTYVRAHAANNECAAVSLRNPSLDVRVVRYVREEPRP